MAGQRQINMSLHFTACHKSAPSRYLVHGLSVRHGERYLGVVFRIGKGGKRWGNTRSPREYSTRQAAGQALFR